MKISLLRLLIIGSAISSIISCSKEKNSDPPPPPADPVLQVNFSITTIDINLVDSGYVVLKKNGSSNQIFKRFEKKTGAFSFSIDDLSAGNWTAELYIFSRYNQSAGRYYRQDKAFTIAGAAQSLQVTGPSGKLVDTWKPYAHFRDAARGISAGVAMNSNDPYFFIEVAESKWDYFFVERHAYKRREGGAKELIRDALWGCHGGTGCYTNDKFINNNTAFVPFGQFLANKDWDHGVIIVEVTDVDGDMITFAHSFDK